MEKKKKSIVLKKIIVSILSILFVVYAYCPSILQVKADTSNVITYNSYGSTTRGTRGFEAFGSTYALIGFIDFNFNGQYNGIINIYLTGASPMSNFSVICENCHILSQSTNYLQIEFYGQNNVSVNFVMKNATAGSFDIQSVTYQSMTKVSDSNSAELVNIKNRLSDIKTYTDGIESLLSTNNSLLNDIKANTANGGSSSSTVNNIDVNVDLIADDLNLLKTSSDGILGALVSFLTDSVGGILTVENVIDAIETTTTALLGVQTQLTTINGQLTSITNLLTSIDTNLQNIDQTIDTITWNNDIAISYTFYDDQMNIITSSTRLNEFYVKTNALTYPNRMYYLEIPFGRNDYYGDYPDVQYGYFYNNQFYPIYNAVQYKGVSRYITYMYIVPYFYSSSSTYTYGFKITYNRTATTYLNSNTVRKYIDDSDIEYWTLLSYFNQYEYNKKLLERINSINISITQNDIDEMNTNITEYNNTMTDINQIENNYINNYNTTNTAIDLTDNSAPSVDLIQGRQRFNSVFNDITGDLRIRGWLIFILICAIILIILGA